MVKPRMRYKPRLMVSLGRGDTKARYGHEDSTELRFA